MNKTQKLSDQKIVIIGAGTAGVMLANKLAKSGFSPYIIEPHDDHYYQPGFLFMPFGRYRVEQLRKPLVKLLKKNVHLIKDSASRINAQENMLELESGESMHYDVLVIATGTVVDASMTAGLMGSGWQKNIFDFYTPNGAAKLKEALRNFDGGKLVVQVMDMPIKCPVAPLEFTFLADDYFRKRNIRENVEITYVTPLSGAFTKPVASSKLGHMLDDRRVAVVADFYTEQVLPDENKVKCFDGREVAYDLLVTVPVNRGVQMLQGLDFTNELGFVEVNHHSLQSPKYPSIFAVGDAADLPTSKAGSVAHFEVDTLLENIQKFISGQELEESFDGHSNCFVEAGNGKALLLDFNYDVEPLEGKFPFAGVGPMNLLNPSRINHIGKLAFRFIYWYMLLPGRKIPFIPAQMSKKGKKFVNQ
jgi:sulfide:quinone oxidoreductase